MHHSPHRVKQTPDTGSALVLLPAITLIVVILLTIVVNAASLYLSQHQLTQVAEACAIQGTRALDADAYYGQGTIELDPRQVQLDVMSCLSTQTQHQTQIVLTYPGPRSLTLDLVQTQRVPLLELLGLSHGTIAASATASASPAPLGNEDF